MERYVFIHGSSVGQSAFIPADVPEAMCNDIANKFFQGRTLRQKESAADIALFIELYKDASEVYTIYSYVNNACFGANGRPGQYFAISIICKGIYVYPETLYNMLDAAYSQLFQSGRVLHRAGDGTTQYTISQFKEQKEYLTAFIKKIEEVFDKVVCGYGLKIDSNTAKAADYDSWSGEKVSLDMCNSNETYAALSNMGRLYVSKEYESPSAVINSLRKQVQALQLEKAEAEKKKSQARLFENSKIRSEIETLNSQLSEKDLKIKTLQSDNANYEATLDIVRKELNKYEKIGGKLTDLQSKKSECQSKSIKDIVKWCLLILIFILTLLSALANFGFFRNLSPLPKAETTGENKEDVGSSGINPVVQESKPTNSLVVAPNNLKFSNGDETQTISVVTDGEWNCQVSNGWLTAQKIDNKTVQIQVKNNPELSEREFTFMIKSGDLEQQVTVTQKGTSAPKSPAPVTYNFKVIDQKTGKDIPINSEVIPGQIITAKVLNPGNNNKYGWSYIRNCSSEQRGNFEEVNIKISENPQGTSAIFSYGKGEQRTRFTLNIASPISEAGTSSKEDSPGTIGVSREPDSSAGESSTTIEKSDTTTAA